MHDLPFMTQRRLAATLLAVSFALPIHATATQTTRQDDGNMQGNAIPTLTTSTAALPQAGNASTFQPGTVLTAPAFAPVFVTREDALAFWNMVAKTYQSPLPDPRTVAKAFIKDRLGIDGDEYVVAHFADVRKRIEGSADGVIVLTDALMQAFPEHSRHTFFGKLADTVGGMAFGGKQSPNAIAFVRSMVTCGSAGECFSRMGRFLWSRTGPGYLYNTLVAGGNVLDTVYEDQRPLDDAFGIYPKTSTFLPEHSSPLLLSEIIGKFKETGAFSELPYIKRLTAELDTYWAAGKSDWPQVARYQFVHLARRARARGELTQPQFELAMKGGAPQVPLQGPIALWQLRNTPPDGSVLVKQFNINGYPASDILRFIAVDGSEVMYIPAAESSFVAFRNEGELRKWTVREAGKPETLDALLSHFSIYNGQDGVFWTGVAEGLARLADGRWAAEVGAIDASNGRIQVDVFEHLRTQVEARLRDDARMRTSTAWDAWRATLNRTATVLAPVGYAPPLAIPVQAGSALITLATGIDQGINGRTAEERTNALDQAVMTVVTNVSLAATVGKFALPAGQETAQPPSTTARATSQASEPAVTTTSLPSPHTDLASPQTVMTATSGTLPPSETVSPWESETRVAYAVESLTPPRERPSEGPRPRQFDPIGTDARTPFSLLADERQAREIGYLVQTVPRDARNWVRRVIDLKKTAIDEARHRLDDFRAESLATNRTGYDLSFDHSLVYRVDSRPPRELLRRGGFGPSGEFNDIEPMLAQPSTIGSGSLRASNTVFVAWQQGYSGLARPPTFHQYAIWTEGRAVASASDNHDGRLYDAILDEVHFPSDVPVQNIFLVDSYNQLFARALADIYASRYVSTPYGVPLEALTEYLAGTLNIDAPNRFTEQHLAGPPSSSTPAQTSTPSSTPSGASAPEPGSQRRSSVR